MLKLKRTDFTRPTDPLSTAVANTIERGRRFLAPEMPAVAGT